MPPTTLDDRHHVCKVLIRPLTICGVERRLFFLALLLGAAGFNLSYSFLAGVLVSATTYGAARIAAAIDPQIFRIAMRSVAARPRYDAARGELGERHR